MLEDKELIESMARSLWQGVGADIAELNKCLDNLTKQMMDGISRLCKIGVEFPTQFIMDAMSHTTESISSRDDFKLADCLYYEWLEIITVYEEVMKETSVE